MAYIILCANKMKCSLKYICYTVSCHTKQCCIFMHIIFDTLYPYIPDSIQWCCLLVLRMWCCADVPCGLDNHIPPVSNFVRRVSGKITTAVIMNANQLIGVLVYST